MACPWSCRGSLVPGNPKYEPVKRSQLLSKLSNPSAKMPMPYDDPPDVLSDSPESQTPRLEVSESSPPTSHDGYNASTIHRQEEKQTSAQQLRTNRAKINDRNHLHPYVQTLSLSNLDSCVALENAVFPEAERCSREKVGPPQSHLLLIPFLSTHSLSVLLLSTFLAIRTLQVVHVVPAQPRL